MGKDWKRAKGLRYAVEYAWPSLAKLFAVIFEAGYWRLNYFAPQDM